MKKQLAIKMGILLSLAAFTMGNEGCEEAQQPESRKLLRRAELDRITAPVLTLPDGKEFDFAYVGNVQFFQAMGDNDRFTAPFVSGTAISPLRETEVMSDRDRQLLAEWTQDSSNLFYTQANSQLSCLQGLPQVMITGAIESFEMKGGGGLYFGFGPNVGSQMPGHTGGMINVSIAQLRTNMQALNPLSLSPMAFARAQENHTKVDLNLTINFGAFHLGPKFFFESPLADVSYRAMIKTFEMLSDDLDARLTQQGEPLWETGIREDYDSHVMIYAGSRHGLKVGDELAIYNMDYEWEDNSKPCGTRLLGRFPSDVDPVAILKIEDNSQLGDDLARPRVISENGDPRRPGARVVIWDLVDTSDKDMK